ncbi:MAG: FAD-dependent oxidoreductase [Planctomycetota bacterium]|nr:FAD-dependent oxidoreductase [Planctomycetota bacterium]
MDPETEILVIGGGAVGICSAHYLCELGCNVTVVEMGEICSGSSYGNAGLIVPSHSVPLAAPGVISKALKWMFNPDSPFYIKPRLNWDIISWLWRFRGACKARHVHQTMPLIRDLSLNSVELFDELAGLDGIDFCYEKKGMLSVYKTQEGFEEGLEEARLLKDIGIEVEELNGEEVHGFEASVRPDVTGGVFYPQDAHLVPDRFVGELARHIEGKGVTILPSTEALGFEASDGQIERVHTTRGTFKVEQVVLASGSWAPGIARELQIKLPIQPAKGYSVTFERPSDGCPGRPVVLAESKVATTPMGDCLRFAGTLEIAGLDLSINQRRVKAILNAVPRYLTGVDPNELELLEIWRGLRPCTPDGLPFLGRAQRYKNLILAAGHAMIGISVSPVTGKLVAQIATGAEPSFDISAMRVERFN